MAKRSSLLAYTLSRLLLALPMLFILLTAALFVATLGLGVLCDRLMERKS